MSRASATEYALAAGAGALLGATATAFANGSWPFAPRGSPQPEPERNQIAGLEDDAAVDELREEQLSRNVLFFGRDGQKAIDAASIVVVGLGGVGSHAAQMLVRAGVGSVRLVDFDQVTLSSLNRHAVATRRDVGRPKVEVTRSHLLETAPWCRIDARNEMFTADAAEALLEGKPDYVLDCIDDVKTKVALLVACRQREIPVLASLGAGAKADPTRVHIGSVTDALVDKLALKIKNLLRQQGVRPDSVTAVFSSEKATRKLATLSGEQRENPDAFGAVPQFRLRVIPVLGTMPAIFGQAMAAKVMTDIAGCPLAPEEHPRIPSRRRSRILNELKTREQKVFGQPRIGLDMEDADYVVRVVWRLRSAISPREMPDATALELTRWDVRRPPTADNVIVVTPKEAEAFKPRPDGSDPRDSLPPGVRERIEARLSDMVRF